MRKATGQQSGRRVRWWVTGALVVSMLGTWMASTACHGNVIRRDFAPNHSADFNFRKPPCQPAAAPAVGDDEIRLSYLGVSGVYIEWRGHALMTAPFFSNYSMLHAGLRSIRWHRERIARGMRDVPQTPGIDLMLVGHSHYDHIGDVPPIAAGWAPDAEIWLNATGRNMLAGCGELADNRIRVLEEHELQWVTPLDAAGARAPFRVMAIPSGHAKHMLGMKFATGELTDRWDDCLEGHKIGRMTDGKTFAFLIDFLDAAGETVFRIHVQDAASDAPAGFPPVDAVADRDVDLAIVCMPSWYNAEDYPRGLLEASHARHVMVTHYEDFTGDEPKLHFVPLLTNGRANRFLETVRDEMATPRHTVTPPLDDVCGPAGDAWSMPLPGEWLRFRTAR